MIQTRKLNFILDGIIFIPKLLRNIQVKNIFKVLIILELFDYYIKI